MLVSFTRVSNNYLGMRQDSDVLLIEPSESERGASFTASPFPSVQTPVWQVARFHSRYFLYEEEKQVPKWQAGDCLLVFKLGLELALSQLLPFVTSKCLEDSSCTSLL